MAEEKPTKEQVAERKKQLEEFYKDQIPFLENQLKYENLITDIQESRARRARAMAMEAQIMAGPQEGEPAGETGEKKEATSETAEKIEMIQPEEGAPKEPRKLKVTQ